MSGELIPLDGMPEEEPEPPKTRVRTIKDDLFDCLIQHFGTPRTRTEEVMFGKVVSELLYAGANEEETNTACSYVIRNFDSPSVFSVVKWFSASQNERQKPKLSPHEQIIETLRRNP